MTPGFWSHLNGSRQPSRTKPFKKRRLAPFGERWRQRHNWQRLNAWLTATLARFGRVDSIADDAFASVKPFPSIGCVKAYILDPYCLAAEFLRHLQKFLAVRFPAWRICLTTDLMLTDGRVHFVGFDIGPDRIESQFWDVPMKLREREEWRAMRRLLRPPWPARHAPRRAVGSGPWLRPPVHEDFGARRVRNLGDYLLDLRRQARHGAQGPIRDPLLKRRLTKPCDREAKRRLIAAPHRVWRWGVAERVVASRVGRALASAGITTGDHPYPSRNYAPVETSMFRNGRVLVYPRHLEVVSPWLLGSLRRCLHGWHGSATIDVVWFGGRGLKAPTFDVRLNRSGAAIRGDLLKIKRAHRREFTWPVGYVADVNKNLWDMPFRAVRLVPWRGRLPPHQDVEFKPAPTWAWDGQRVRSVDTVE